MKKTCTWAQPKIATANRRPGSYGSFKEMFAKAQDLETEQREAMEYLKKAEPMMVALLEVRLKEQHPLIVMRPFQYQTSEIDKAEDDGFYNNRNKATPKFTDVMKVITPGTQLILKSLDTVLREFVFEDGRGKEHSVSFDYRNQLMTQTDIFETVKKFLEIKGVRHE